MEKDPYFERRKLLQTLTAKTHRGLYHKIFQPKMCGERSDIY